MGAVQYNMQMIKLVNMYCDAWRISRPDKSLVWMWNYIFCVCSAQVWATANQSLNARHGADNLRR